MASAEPKERPMIEHALDYLHAGLPIFPVCSPLMPIHEHRDPDTKKIFVCETPKTLGKTPLVRWRGYQSQLPEEDDIRLWWRKWPQANIGLATGELSGILVLDADGTEARKEVLRRGGLENTPTVWTGKIGGAHFHLAYPGGDVRNFARKLPGTDMRGQGGYALLPPSVHATGNVYRWADGTRHLPHAPVPEWLTELFTAAPEAAGEFQGTIDLDEILTGIPEGKRDDTLFRYACKLRHDDMPQAEAEERLRLAARACTPPFDEAAAVGKVRRAYSNPEYDPPGSPTVEVDEFFAPPSGGGARADESPLADSDEVPATWQVFDIADFLAIEYPPVAWRIEGYMRDRAILFSFGAPGSIKTFLATDAALAMASGTAFLNKFRCLPGRVLIVQEDTLASDYQSAYLRPMMKARGLTGDDLRGKLFIAPQAEFSLDDNERLRDLCRWLDEHKPDLLILDAFYLMYSGRKEDLLTVMKLIKKIRNKYGCAIWVIDHNRKGQGDSSGENAIDRLINGREKSAAVDVVMESRPVKGEQGSAFIEVLKIRGAKHPDPVRIAYEDGLMTVEGDDESSPRGAAQTVYEWLCREGGSRTKAQIARGCDLSERSVHYAVGELAMAGRAQKSGKQGRADLWIAIRMADAEPQRQPNIDFDEEILP